MFALCFDMVIANLEKYYGTPYNSAYYEIKTVLEGNGFVWMHGSTYIVDTEDLAVIMKTIMELSKIEWFKKSVRDIRAFRVENWSDFTDLVKNS